MNQLLKPAFITVALVIMILASWVLSASYLDLTFFSSQKSALLLKVGAIDGATWSDGESWRLITSQFLHVHFFHMLFNVCSIYVLANSIERLAGKLLLIIVYVGGGVVGQYFSVRFHPELVSSGASQALMSLCGFVLTTCLRFTFPRPVIVAALVIAGMQAALDIAVSASIKPGHGLGFAAGAIVGLGAIAYLNNTAKPKSGD